MFQLLADLIVVLHLGFVVFIVLGGFLVLRWPKGAWFHAPSVLWGAWVEFAGWICPLTPLENWLREKAGVGTYARGFVEQYLLRVLYPERMPAYLPIVLGALVLAINVPIYVRVVRRALGRRRTAVRIRSPAGSA